MNNAACTVALTETDTTIAVTGDLVNGLNAADLAAFTAAVAGTEGGPLTLDFTGITSLGVCGMNLLFGAYRGAPRGTLITTTASPDWARTISLITRRAL